MLKRLNKPEYFLQPSRAIKRLFGPEPGQASSTRLPWGHVIDVIPGESIGAVLCRSGIFDLALTEALFRLVKPGDFVFDCGANIGYMSSVLAHCAGKAGLVAAFEPNPAVLEVLRGNARRWSQMPDVARIKVVPQAIGSHAHVARFCPSGWDSAIGRLGDDGEVGIHVAVTSVDDQVMEIGRIPDLVKIDTEGSELQVLLGAGASLAAKRLKHIVLEDWLFGHSDAVRHLHDHGFQIFALDRSWHGPLLRPGFTRTEFPPWEAPNYLATRDAEVVIENFRVRGWRCLGF